MSRLDQQRESTLQPKRVEYAIEQISKLGYKVEQKSDDCIEFIFGGQVIRFYPYSGWATGKTINDGRGIANLLKQITPLNKPNE
jgi:hypothetical protein